MTRPHILQLLIENLHAQETDLAGTDQKPPDHLQRGSTRETASFPSCGAWRGLLQDTFMNSPSLGFIHQQLQCWWWRNKLRDLVSLWCGEESLYLVAQKTLQIQYCASPIPAEGTDVLGTGNAADGPVSGSCCAPLTGGCTSAEHENISVFTQPNMLHCGLLRSTALGWQEQLVQLSALWPWLPQNQPMALGARGWHKQDVTGCLTGWVVWSSNQRAKQP